jgi:hypothetical protein
MSNSGLFEHCSREVDLADSVDSVAGGTVAPPAVAASNVAAESTALHGAVVGVLIGFGDGGRTPLVIFPGQAGNAAVSARATLDLHGPHIGRNVVLVFEDAQPSRPIIVGCLQRADGWPAASRPVEVEVESDGERVIVSAREQLVLRCGKASITLTRSGKILLEAAYLSANSQGVVRIVGGSVHLN